MQSENNHTGRFAELNGFCKVLCPCDFSEGSLLDKYYDSFTDKGKSASTVARNLTIFNMICWVTWSIVSATKLLMVQVLF